MFFCVMDKKVLRNILKIVSHSAQVNVSVKVKKPNSISINLDAELFETSMSRKAQQILTNVINQDVAGSSNTSTRVLRPRNVIQTNTTTSSHRKQNKRKKEDDVLQDSSTSKRGRVQKTEKNGNKTASTKRVKRNKNKQIEEVDDSLEIISTNEVTELNKTNDELSIEKLIIEQIKSNTRVPKVLLEQSKEIIKMLEEKYMKIDENTNINNVSVAYVDFNDIQPLYMTHKAPLLPTYDCYDSDDERYREIAPTINKPTWISGDSKYITCRVMGFIEPSVKNTMFCLEPQTLDLREVFPTLHPNILKRASSAMWLNAPRFTQHKIHFED